MIKSLSDAWYEMCLELWELSETRPYLRQDATMWDGFKYMYMKLAPHNERGRNSLKGLE